MAEGLRQKKVILVMINAEGLSGINRSDLMKLLAHKHNLTPFEAERLVKTILDAIAQALSQRKRIELRGFGSFESRYRTPRAARNPKTGEKVQTEGKYSVHFKAGKELRERVNKKA